VISCWVIDRKNGNATKDYVTGDASMAAAPLVSASTKIKVFAGLRDDPFFFNIRGFKDAVGVVEGGKTPVSMMNFTTDPKTTCVNNLNMQDVGAVIKVLGHNTGGTMPAVDDFAKGGVLFTSGNVLSIVIAIDKTLLSTGMGTTMGVWGSTNN
jgi:uncharacterized protein DUF4331